MMAYPRYQEDHRISVNDISNGKGVLYAIVLSILSVILVRSDGTSQSNAVRLQPSIATDMLARGRRGLFRVYLHTICLNPCPVICLVCFLTFDSHLLRL